MAVSFTAVNYLAPGLALCLGSLFGSLLLLLPLSRWIAKRTRNPFAGLVPIILVFAVVMAGLFRHVIPALEPTECLYPPERAYTHTTAGTVTAVRGTEHLPLFWFDGEFRGGVYVTIDGEAYFSIAHPLLTEGTSLHFTYCPDQNLIVSFSPIDLSQVPGLQTPFVMPEPVPEEPVPRVQGIIGSVLTCLGWLGLIAYIFLTDKLELHITGYLLRHDRRQRFEVVPNYSGLGLKLLPLLPMTMLILGAVLSSQAYSALLILFLGGSGMVGWTLLSRTWLRVEGRVIRIRRFGREYTRPLSQLRTVFWSRSEGPLRQRCLVLEFDDGKLRLNQEDCCGLEDLHRRLSAYFKTIN